MKVIKEISEGLGLQTVTIDLDVITDPVILGEEFEYIICIQAGDKDVKLDSLDVALFWWHVDREFNPYNQGVDHVTKPPVLVHEFKTTDPVEIPSKRETFYRLRATADSDFKYSRKGVGWFLKVHADIPWAPDEKKQFPLDVIPKFDLSAPLLAMTKELGYSEEKEKRDGDERLVRYRLLPSRNMSSFIKFVDLEVEDLADGTIKIQIELELWHDKDQNPWIEEETRTVVRRLYLNKGELIKMNGEKNTPRITRSMNETILHTINQFLEDPYVGSDNEDP